MKNILGTVSKAIGWILFIVVFSAIGLGNEKPIMAMVMYGIVMTALLAIFLVYQSTHKRRSFEIRKKNPLIYLIGGALVLIVSILVPVYFFESFRPGTLVMLFSKGSQAVSAMVPYSIITLLTLVMMLAAFFTIRFINNNVHKPVYYRLAGYLVLLILAAVPGLSIMSKDSSYGMLGLIYYMTLVTAAMGWAGASIFNTGLKLKKIQE